MLKKIDNNLLVGLDIGTSKVAVVVAEMLPNGGIDIIGFGSRSCKGLKKGVIVNVDATVASIQQVVEEAELMAGCKINSVYVGISGNHINSFNSNGVTAIQNTEVTQADIDKVLNAARAIAIPADQKILHIIPQEYIIDRQPGIHFPIGMSGVRLEARVHVVTGSVSVAQNIITCLRKCNLEIDDIVLQPLAAGYAALSEDEKQLGVCLVDIGGGTTDVILYIDGTVQHSFVLPVAGDQITNDLAVALRQPAQTAEIIKVQHACAYIPMADAEHTINLNSEDYSKEQVISQKYLAEIVEPRYTELFELISEELHRAGFRNIPPAGIVLTGGSSQMHGVQELAENVFQAPVRLGMPQHITDMHDLIKDLCFASVVGLPLYGSNFQKHKVDKTFAAVESIKGVFDRVKHWFQGNF
jgi:cell division protein FtsA